MIQIGISNSLTIRIIAFHMIRNPWIVIGNVFQVTRRLYITCKSQSYIFTSIMLYIVRVWVNNSKCDYSTMRHSTCVFHGDVIHNFRDDRGIYIKAILYIFTRKYSISKPTQAENMHIYLLDKLNFSISPIWQFQESGIARWCENLHFNSR